MKLNQLDPSEVKYRELILDISKVLPSWIKLKSTEPSTVVTKGFMALSGIDDDNREVSVKISRSGSTAFITVHIQKDDPDTAKEFEPLVKLIIGPKHVRGYSNQLSTTGTFSASIHLK